MVRFGQDSDAVCMQMDEVLASVADQIKNFAVIYLVDIAEVRLLLPEAASTAWLRITCTRSQVCQRVHQLCADSTVAYSCTAARSRPRFQSNSSALIE